MAHGNLVRWPATSQLAQILMATIAGVVTGWIAFDIIAMSERDLFLVLGGAAGAAAAVVAQVYWRTATLTEVKVSIPQFSELTFMVNNDARNTAWDLFIEVATRSATQPLGSDDGLLREALTSLHGLFGTVRETLKDSRPSVPGPGHQTVEHLAVTMLNLELRPLLSKWHPRLRRFEQASPGGPEAAWPEAGDCRREIRRTQERLLAYALGFARLAGVQDAEAMVARVGGAA